MSGTLYLCATPIGNLGDVSARFLEVFNSVDIIACEDTRVTMKLLNRFEISKPLTSYHEHNKKEKGAYLIKLLGDGKNVALVSDAGTTGICDPGEDLVKLCIENDITVTSIPGPVAGINALILSGLSTKRFAFEGFLPVNKRNKAEHLDKVKNDDRTLIFYEAPHKLKTTLDAMAVAFGENRRIALCRELTKIHEEVKRTTLADAIAFYQEEAPRGEYVIVVEGATEVEDDAPFWADLSVKAHVDYYIEKGSTSKEAIKQVAIDRDTKKSDIYAIYHEI